MANDDSRETADRARQANDAGPQIAALLAVGRGAAPTVPMVTLNSEGVTLIYGRDERALEAAALLEDQLDVTVMIAATSDFSGPGVGEFPIVKGSIRTAKGHLGAFTITVDDFATAAPSSRGILTFGLAKDGAVSHCDIILDLSGDPPLFSAHELRDGYIRVDPRHAGGILPAVSKALALTGVFDKPRYIDFDNDICAHARSRIVGCRRCIDLCPAGAISPAGDHVAVDPMVCAGCGQCAAVCPTGAAAYTLPPVDGLMQKMRTM